MKYITLILAFLIASCGQKNQDVLFQNNSTSEGVKIKSTWFNSESIEIFLEVLSKEYAARGEELKKDGYLVDAQAFMKKSQLAKNRDATHYNENTFMLPKKKQDEAELGRLFLDKIKGNVAIFDLFPESIARMQSYYDCMIVEFRDSGYEKKQRNRCTKQFDTMQKAFQRTGFSKNIKYEIENERRETFVIYFDLNSDVIKPEFYETLNTISRKAKSLKSYKIKVIGLADKTGSKEVNTAISKARAKNTKTSLVKMGVPEDFIEVDYLADKFTLVETQKAEKFNRRVVIDLISND